MKEKLSERQLAFVDHYVRLGSAEVAAREAGYSVNTARGHAHKLLQNVAIRNEIEKRNASIKNDRIADMKEVKEFWSNTMRNQESELKDRLKASEYIAKTNAAFVDKVEHSGEMTTKQEVKHDLSKLSTDELKQFMQLLNKTEGE